jgi:hypothetical protein
MLRKLPYYVKVSVPFLWLVDVEARVLTARSLALKSITKHPVSARMKPLVVAQITAPLDERRSGSGRAGSRRSDGDLPHLRYIHKMKLVDHSAYAPRRRKP